MSCSAPSIGQPLSNPVSGHTKPVRTQFQQARKPVTTQDSPMTAAISNSPSQSSPTSDGQAKLVPQKTGNLTPHEQAQVAALLNLNNIILRQVQKLQESGAFTQTTQASPQQHSTSLSQQSTPDNTRDAQKSPTGATQPSTSTTPTPQTPKATKPSPKQIYDNYLKRVQLTIAYLLAVSQAKPAPPYPPSMEPPPVNWFIPGPGETAPDDAEQRGREAFNEVKQAYQKLKELWPNYQPQARPPQQMRNPQQQQQQQAQVQQTAAGGQAVQNSTSMLTQGTTPHQSSVQP